MVTYLMARLAVFVSQNIHHRQHMELVNMLTLTHSFYGALLDGKVGSLSRNVHHNQNSCHTNDDLLDARSVVFLSFHPCHFCHINGDVLDGKFGSLSRNIHHNQNMVVISVILMKVVDIVKVPSTLKMYICALQSICSLQIFTTTISLIILIIFINQKHPTVRMVCQRPN